MTPADALPGIAAVRPVSTGQIAEVAVYLAQNFHGEGEGWRSTAQVADALNLSVIEARVRLNATQLAALCECRMKWGIYYWRVRP